MLPWPCPALLPGNRIEQFLQAALILLRYQVQLSLVVARGPPWRRCPRPWHLLAFAAGIPRPITLIAALVFQSPTSRVPLLPRAIPPHKPRNRILTRSYAHQRHAPLLLLLPFRLLLFLPLLPSGPGLCRGLFFLKLLPDPFLLCLLLLSAFCAGHGRATCRRLVCLSNLF